MLACIPQSPAARDVVAPELLSNELTHAVDETPQPAHVGLWLRPADRSK